MPTPTSGITIAQTHTVEEFVNRKYEDELTYRNFSIVEYADDIELIDRNLIGEYLPEILANCDMYKFTIQEYRKYKYAPDLLSYDLYHTTQLDFLLMLVNDMIDPKEFNLKRIKLPRVQVLNRIFSDILSVNSGYIDQNRADFKLTY